MKTVAVPAGASAAFSSEVLLGNVEEQTRWGLGSLCAAILSKSAVPLLIAIRSTTQGVASLVAVDGTSYDLTSPAPAGDIVIARDSGTSKSRPVIFSSPTVVYSSGQIDTVNAILFDSANPIHSLVSSLLIAQRPAFSLLGIMNKLEGFLDQLAPGWGVLIDQATEKIYFVADVAVEPIYYTAVDAAAKIASFTLTADAVNEVIPGYGWE